MKAKEVLVEGTVEGDVFGTERIKVCETGRVVGNVHSPRIGVTEGATFKGSVDMDSDAKAIEQRYSELVGKRVEAMQAQAADSNVENFNEAQAKSDKLKSARRGTTRKEVQPCSDQNQAKEEIEETSVNQTSG